MLDLKIGNIKFKSPLMVASGTFGYGNEVDDIVDIDKLGAIITKSVTRLPREGNKPPRIAEVEAGMLNSIGLANLGVEEYVKTKIPYLNQLKTNLIINIAGSAFEDYIETMEILESSDGNQVGYEINISCPNVKEGGMEFGVDPGLTSKLTSELRSRTDKLLIMKLSPNVTNISEIGLAAQNAGADAVSAINTVVGMAIDLSSKAPKLSTGVGGLSGPCIKPIAIANVYKLHLSLSIPIIGIGGISNFNDALEFIFAGASMVQVGSMNYKFPNIANQISDDLKEYLDKNNINISSLIGSVNDSK